MKDTYYFLFVFIKQIHFKTKSFFNDEHLWSKKSVIL